MIYGFCTCFATPHKDTVDFELLTRIQQAGFDVVELPLTLIAVLGDPAFVELKAALHDMQLDSSVCTNLLPDDMPISGPGSDAGRLREYLAAALERAAQLKVQKLVFASVSAWQIPPDGTRQQGYERIASFFNETLLPKCRRHDMSIVIEPLRRTVCNLINTLDDGMKLVRLVDSPSVRLMADSYHMLENEEDPIAIESYAPYLEHIHIVESGRALPLNGFSPELSAILHHLKAGGYDGSISFEPLEGQDEAKMAAALALLKSHFE